MPLLGSRRSPPPRPSASGDLPAQLVCSAGCTRVLPLPPHTTMATMTPFPSLYGSAGGNRAVNKTPPAQFDHPREEGVLKCHLERLDGRRRVSNGPNSNHFMMILQGKLEIGGPVPLIWGRCSPGRGGQRFGAARISCIPRLLPDWIPKAGDLEGWRFGSRGVGGGALRVPFEGIHPSLFSQCQTKTTKNWFPKTQKSVSTRIWYKEGVVLSKGGVPPDRGPSYLDFTKSQTNIFQFRKFFAHKSAHSLHFRGGDFPCPTLAPGKNGSLWRNV